MTDNKFSKYLIYAIGEIALVMIGILLALQINNWNESNKNKVLVNSYRSNLMENLTKDSINISENLMKIKTELTILQEFERRVAMSLAPLDTILKIARNDYEFYISAQIDYDKDTYQVLTTTGHISLFNTEIINDLNILYNLQDRALASHIQSFETYRNGLTQYAQKYPISFQNNLLQNGTIAADTIWEEISLSQHATLFNALVIAKADSYRLSLRYLPGILDKTIELLGKFRK